jgi:hypothetical protein
MAERDPSLAQVIRRDLQRHLVAGDDADVVLAHLARGVGDEIVPVVQANAVAGVGKYVCHDAVHFEHFFLGHDGASTEQ